MGPAHSSPFRRPADLVVAAGLLVLLSGSLSAERQKATPPAADAPTVAHVLNRVAFGARPGDIARVQAMGVSAYIDRQLHPERIDDSALDSRLAEFETLQMSTRDLAAKYYLPAQQLRRQQKQDTPAVAPAAPRMDQGDGMAAAAPAADAKALASPEVRQAQMAEQGVVNDLVQAKVLRAALSERQLDEVLVDFWFNHFNVFVGKGQVRLYLTEYERDTIRPHVLGSFRDLLGAVAHSPAMLFYLDNWQSTTPNPQPEMSEQVRQRLNDPRLRPEQRAQILQRLEQRQALDKAQAKGPPRGINENYAREIMELHTLGVDGGYTQADVIALARILTGWTIDRPQQGGSFVFRPQMHDTGEKMFLGVRFSAAGESEGERALDLLAAHPSTAHHIAYELAQRFVADEPPAALVDRAAKKFIDSKGDLREVVRLILTSPEFLSPDAVRVKVKTPFEFIVSTLRATGATIVSAQPMAAALRTLGMPLYGCQPPTGYSMTADAWVNTGALLSRMNFAVQVVQQGGRAPQPAGRGGGAGNGRGAGLLAQAGRGALARAPVQVDVHALAPDTSDASRDGVIQAMLAGQVSEATRQTLARAETPQNLVTLALGSPEFQRR